MLSSFITLLIMPLFKAEFASLFLAFPVQLISSFVLLPSVAVKLPLSKAEFVFISLFLAFPVRSISFFLSLPSVSVKLPLSHDLHYLSGSSPVT